MRGILRIIAGCLLSLFVVASVALAEEKKESKEEKKEAELEEIVVTATKTERVLADLPIETSLVTKEDIENSNSQTVADLLKYIPGIEVGYYDDRPGSINWRATFRGLSFSAGYGLVLIDGQRVRGMDAWGYGLNQIPPEIVERIEVVKGPSSVLYGSDAMAGVVNIITKATPEKRFVSVNAGYGSNGDANGGLSFGDRIDKFGYILNYSREKSSSGKYGADDKYEADFMYGKFSYELKENMKLNLGISYDKKSWNYSDWDSIRISPGWETKFNDGSKLIIRGYYYDWDFHHFTPGYTEQKGDIGYRQVESQYSRLLFDKHMATVGLDFLREVIDFNLADKNVDTYSVFFQDEWAVLNNLELILGVRFDSHSEFGEEVNPRISGRFSINDRTRLKASVGKSFKSPTIAQLYYNTPYRHGTYYMQANPDLTPEHGIGYSLGLEYEFSDRLLLDVGVFRNDVRDMVVTYDTGDTYSGKPLYSYKNVAEAYTQGIELELVVNIFECLASSLSYTFLDTEDKDSKKELTYRPRNTIGWRLNYDNKKNGFKTNFGLRYVDSMYKDTANTTETDSYFVGEIKIVKEITEHAKFSLEIDNLFNTEYGDPSMDREGTTLMCKVSFKF